MLKHLTDPEPSEGDSAHGATLPASPARGCSGCGRDTAHVVHGWPVCVLAGDDDVQMLGSAVVPTCAAV